jgi:probable phosphoglycerate mutase
MKIIYLIRHGQTEFNKQSMVQGRGIDSNLNDTGIWQAETFFAKYNQIPFDRVITSSLKRTHQTVRKFIDSGIPWIPSNGFDEFDWGSYEGKSFETGSNSFYKHMIESWQKGDLHVKSPQGESPLDVKKRLETAFNELTTQFSDENIWLICMHGRAMRLFLTMLTGQSPSEMETFEHSNTCLYVLERGKNTENYEIKISNNTDHLITNA